MKNNENQDFKAFLQSIKKGYLVIVFTTIAFACFSIFYSLSLKDIYRSEALLAPVQDEANDVRNAARSLNQLSNIAGFNLASNSSNQVDQAMQVIRSFRFFSYLDKKYNIRPDLMASVKWDKAQRLLSYDAKLYDQENLTWEANDEQGINGPSLQKSYKEFLSKLIVSENSDTGFISVSIEHISPDVAKNWVDIIIYEINETFRVEAINRSNKSIDYIKIQQKDLSLNQVNNVLSNLIEDQIRTIMLAKSSPEFVFKIIESPISSEEKIKPLRSLICILGTFFGFFLGVIYSLIMHLPREGK